MVQRRSLTLTAEQHAELVQHRDHDPRPDLRERWGALLKLAAGHSAHAVARPGLLKPRDPDTVYGWLHRYEQEGVAGLVAHRHGGPRRRCLRPVGRRRARAPTAPGAGRGGGGRAGGGPGRATAPSVDAADDPRHGAGAPGVLAEWGLARAAAGGSSPCARGASSSAYAEKVARLDACLREAAAEPRTVVLCLDEMGFTRWPAPGPAWSPRAPAAGPVATRAGTTRQQWRLIGGLNAITGQVDWLDNDSVGRERVIALYQQLDARYAAAERLYVVQDNWSIPRHQEVLAALATLPRIEPVWLPTYAPWLNPIEKL